MTCFWNSILNIFIYFVIKQLFVFHRFIYESRIDGFQNKLYISQAKLTLPTFEHYSSPEFRHILKKYILKTIKLLIKTDELSEKFSLSKDQSDLEEKIEDIVNFEVALSIRAQRPDLINFESIPLENADNLASIRHCLIWILLCRNSFEFSSSYKMAFVKNTTKITLVLYVKLNCTSSASQKSLKLKKIWITATFWLLFS